ncbi:MAG: hypothetical protein JW833_10000 [Prolixibacteraceae bacterium]|nr:hypothetical protein [Prolixibacteraceae bacterium]
MSRSDIIITLFTIIYGLMLTDLFFSFHKLVRVTKKVEWHWLPLLAAWFLFLSILKNWWNLVFMQEDLHWFTVPFFIAYGHLLFLIFLIVSAVLPDKVPENGINLKEYYFRNHSYFWGLMSAMLFVTLLISIAKSLVNNMAIELTQSLATGILIGLTAMLALTKKYWIHASTLILLTTLMILEILNA